MVRPDIAVAIESGQATATAAIENMDAWYASKVAASQHWYEVPTVEEKRKCLREFQQYTNHDSVPMSVCGVCAELVDISRSEKIDKHSEELKVLTPIGGTEPLIDKCGMDGEAIRVCKTCRWALRKR
jgi:hypothetical protein